MFIATQSCAVYGNRLVVVARAYIIVDAHLALSAVDLVIVYAHDLHVPGLVTIRCRGEYALDIKILDIISPGLDQGSHLIHLVTGELVTEVAILHTILRIGHSSASLYG